MFRGRMDNRLCRFESYRKECGQDGCCENPRKKIRDYRLNHKRKELGLWPEERYIGPFREMEYLEFLKTKIELATESGFEIDKSKINKALKPHQKDAVAWALKGGRRALFESFGL